MHILDADPRVWHAGSASWDADVPLLRQAPSPLFEGTSAYALQLGVICCIPYLVPYPRDHHHHTANLLTQSLKYAKAGIILRLRTTWAEHCEVQLVFLLAYVPYSHPVVPCN